MSASKIEARRLAIRKTLQTLSGATAAAKKDLLAKLNIGTYDDTMHPLFNDVQNEGIDAETALEALAKELKEELPTLKQRTRKPVDRRLTGITESPIMKSPNPKGPVERSSRCGVCFQSSPPPDEWCGTCGLAVHSQCAQFEGTEAASGAISPFRIDVDKGTGQKTCGYCRAARKMTSRGVKDLHKPNQVVCEVCNQFGSFALLTNLSGAATKWVHVCCARYLPGSSLGLTGARRYAGLDKDTLTCSLCENKVGVVTRCIMCEEESAEKVHVFCALTRGGYGIKPLDPAHPQKRLLCPNHKPKSGQVAKRQAVGNGAGAAVGTVNASTTQLGIAAELQSSFHPLGTADRCGVCLSTNLKKDDAFLVCDGCDVRIHAQCFRKVTKGSSEATTLHQFYCNRCSERNFRGRIGKCALCPHVSAMLALQPLPVPSGQNGPASTSNGAAKVFVHTACLSATPPPVSEHQQALPQRKCSLCGDKAGSLVQCSDCPNLFHALCMLLLCESSRQRSQQQQADQAITKCLAHCQHSHPVSTISPVTVEFSIGTAFRMYRREMSAVADFAFAKMAREDINILKEWHSLSREEKTAMTMAGAPPVQPATELVTIPAPIVQQTLAAIARAWEQTQADGLKKRSRGGIPSSGVAAALSSLGKTSMSSAAASAAPVRSSARKKNLLSGGGGGGDENEASGGYYARPLKASDAPIEVSEVWPLLEPVFRKPASVSRIVEALERDRACDHVLIPPPQQQQGSVTSTSRLPEVKLYPDQPYSANPYVPVVFSQFVPLDRSEIRQVPVAIAGTSLIVRAATLRDTDEFVARRCCLGRRKNDTDVASLTLLLTRAMTQPSHLLLIASRMIEERQEAIEGLLHCCYVENEASRVAFVKINASSPETMCILLEQCLSPNSTYMPKDVILDTVYICALDEDQEQRFWKCIFPSPELLQPLVIQQGHIPGHYALPLRGSGWFDYLSRFCTALRAPIPSDASQSTDQWDREDIKQCLEQCWRRVNEPGRALQLPDSSGIVRRARFSVVFEPSNAQVSGEPLLSLSSSSSTSTGPVDPPSNNHATVSSSDPINKPDAVPSSIVVNNSSAVPSSMLVGNAATVPSSMTVNNTVEAPSAIVANMPKVVSASMPLRIPSTIPSSMMGNSNGASSAVPTATMNGTSSQQPQQRQNTPWAFTVRADESMDAAPVVALGPRFSKDVETNISAIEVSEVDLRAEASRSLLPMLDPVVANTMARHIDRLQRELRLLRDMNDRCVAVVRGRIAEDQARMKRIEHAKSEVEQVYKDRKRRLGERQERARIQAEMDATARCGVCRNDESFVDNPIIICEACSWAAHQHCVGLAAVPEGAWYCANCEGKTEEELEMERRARSKRKGKKREYIPVRKQEPAIGGMGWEATGMPAPSPPLEEEERNRGAVSSVSPHVALSASRREERASSGPLLCVCQSRYDEDRFMLSCDRCANWFHPGCIGYRECNDPKLARHPNCVILDNGTHTLDVADWTFMCPRCAQNRGKPSLTKNERPHQGRVAASTVQGESVNKRARRTNSRRSSMAETEEEEEYEELDDEEDEEEESSESDDAAEEEAQDMVVPKRKRGRPRLNGN